MPRGHIVDRTFRIFKPNADPSVSIDVEYFSKLPSVDLNQPDNVCW
jgi:hypothetical protein